MLMGSLTTMDAGRICTRLAAFSRLGAHDGTVHTVFGHAVNVELGGRLMSAVMAPRSLAPYGCSVEAVKPFSCMGILRGGAVRLTREGLSFENGTSIALETAAETELSVESIACDSKQTRLQPRLRPVLAVLRAGEEAQGLSPLVTGGAGNIFSAFLAPRLEALFDAVGRADPRAETLAARAAGCGAGLTPSSDDLLTGYFLTVRLLSRFGRMADARALLPGMAAAAAEKTNRISGTFLLDSGEGLASQDVLLLLNALFSDAPEAALLNAAECVASFGSTSGRDMLTGLVLAIQHHDGGKNSGQTGNQKERLL